MKSKQTLLILFVFLLVVSFSIFILRENNLRKNIVVNNSASKKAIHQQSTINVKDFGAIGDGKVDDTKSIQEAIDSVKAGGSIIFESNMTYRITDTITVSKDISLISNGDKSVTLFMDNNAGDKPALQLTGKLKYITNIKNNKIKVRDNTLKLSKVKNLKPGDLLLIESNSPWYFDPRTGTENLHKGELHRISSLNKSSVLLEDEIRDTYNPNAENIKVKLIDPIKVTVDKINIVRNQSKSRTVGIRLTYCSDCTVNNVNIKHSVANGIHIVSSYRTSVDHCFIVGANDKRSGYGIQSYGSTYSLIRDNEIIGSRRGIDISGKYPDYNSTIEFNHVFGGGKNELGKNYITEDTQYGIGTHSTANFTVFRGNELGNLNYGINIRSANVKIEQNQFEGYIKGSCILLLYGKNVEIGDNTTNSLSPLFPANIKLPENIKGSFINSFLLVKRSYDLNNTELFIENNRVFNLSNEFVRILDANNTNNSKIKNLKITNNQIKFTGLPSGHKNNYFINSDFPITAPNALISGNNIIDSKGSPIGMINNNYNKNLIK